MLLALASCEETTAAPPPVPQGIAATAVQPQGIATGEVDPETDPSAVPDPSAACAPRDPSLRAMQLLAFSFASGLEGRDARDRVEAVHPGERVYAHFTLRNRSGRRRCIRLEFRVNGEIRTELVLEVGKSWSWRTWAYNTVRSDDRAPGRLELSVHDDQGALVLERSVPIVPR